MTTRERLRQEGEAMRRRLFGEAADAVSQKVPGLPQLVAEMVYANVWARPGLALGERMIATLAALAALSRRPQLRRHVTAALDLGLTPQAIVEIFIQCGIYAGFPASLEAIAEASAVFDERALSLPEMPPRDDPLDELTRRGRALLEELHGARGYEGYAAPDNRVTGALYPVAVQYGYGEIWDRPGLDRRARALVAVAAFTALRLEGQVKKFGQSALNAGLSRSEIIEAVIQTGPYSGFAPALNALAQLTDALG
jgi:4-carboxymuconolactone decarboxylase